MSAWNYAPLAELGKITTGSTPKSTDPDTYDGPIPFVAPSDLGSLAPIFSAARSLSTAGSRIARVLPACSVLVCCIGTVGKVGIAGTPLATNQQINAITFKNDLVDARYGLHALHFMKTEIPSLSSATTMPIINKSRFEKLEIPLPPISVQRNIANALDCTETLRVKRREVIALLGDLRQAIFLDMFGNPVSNPEGWPMVRLAELGSLDRGVSKRRPRNAPELLGGKYPLVQTGDVAASQGYITEWKATYSDVGLAQSKLWSSGTLCITIAANIAKTGILKFDACFPDSVVGFSSTPDIVEYVQVWLSFHRENLERLAPESAQKNINLDVLRGLDIPKPGSGLISSFAERIRAINTLKVALRSHLTELDALFASLQHRAFRGELWADSPVA